MNDKLAYVRDSILRFMTPPRREPISEWARKNIRLPSDTSEPGYYNPRRAPYQIEILDNASPQSPTREIVLVFAAQTGKTLIEQLIMSYYIKAYPRPQAFAFSDEGELKAFVKLKFNTFLSSNTEILDVLGRNSKTSGDTLTEKQYPGGFIRFVAANVEKNLRSYSVEIGIMDEVDTYPANVGGNGSPITQFQKRLATFAETSKFILSSTPSNQDSLILDRLAQTTYNKYMVPCPSCKKLLTLEWEYMHWRTDDSNKTVEDAWMECPHCKCHINNSDKTWMLDPDNGAHWEPTNMNASIERQGYFLPATYAPVGWVSWKNLVQTYIDALTSSPDQKEINLIAFYNTSLCRQFNSNNDDVPRVDDLISYASKSNYRRNVVPSWVGVITTGTDVQKNRLETTIMGWGKRGRNIVIDHVVFHLEPQESMDDLNNTAWRDYYDEILLGTWVRDDGFVLNSLANGLDRSYQSLTVDNFYLQAQSSSLYPIRGVDNMSASSSLLPVEKQNRQSRGAKYWDTPVSKIKGIIYEELKRSIRNEENEYTPYCLAEFPADLPVEFFEQLVSERLVYNKEKRKMVWTKIRERNEALDTRVYNYAACYITGLNALPDDVWDEIFDNQKNQVKKMGELRTYARTRKKKKILSKGIL